MNKNHLQDIVDDIYFCIVYMQFLVKIDHLHEQLNNKLDKVQHHQNVYPNLISIIPMHPIQMIQKKIKPNKKKINLCELFILLLSFLKSIFCIDLHLLLISLMNLYLMVLKDKLLVKRW